MNKKFLSVYDSVGEIPNDYGDYIMVVNVTDPNIGSNWESRKNLISNYKKNGWDNHFNKENHFIGLFEQNGKHFIICHHGSPVDKTQPNYLSLIKSKNHLENIQNQTQNKIYNYSKMLHIPIEEESFYLDEKKYRKPKIHYTNTINVPQLQSENTFNFNQGLHDSKNKKQFFCKRNGKFYLISVPTNKDCDLDIPYEIDKKTKKKFLQNGIEKYKYKQLL
jgi:hypothetical protein